jgi:hypothetical protein
MDGNGVVMLGKVVSCERKGEGDDKGGKKKWALNSSSCSNLRWRSMRPQWTAVSTGLAAEWQDSNMFFESFFPPGIWVDYVLCRLYLFFLNKPCNPIDIRRIPYISHNYLISLTFGFTTWPSNANQSEYFKMWSSFSPLKLPHVAMFGWIHYIFTQEVAKSEILKNMQVNKLVLQ